MASYQLLDENDAARDVTMRASEVMAEKYVVVKLHTTPGYVALPDAETDIPYGILQTTAAAVGDAVRVRPISSGCRSLVRAESSFSVGNILSCAEAGGKVDTLVAGDYPIGLALEAATAEDDEVACQLQGGLIVLA